MSKPPADHHISISDSFTPELRDAILEKLRDRIGDPNYRQLTPERFRALAKVVSEQHPVLSVYLRLDPARRSSGGWRAALKDLARDAIAAVPGHHARERLSGEIARIESTLEAEMPGLGRAAAFFTCEAIGLWAQFSVPVELPDLVIVDSRPYLRPLLRVADEHERFVLALLGAELSRFFISQIGQAEEVLTLTGPKLRGLLTDRVPKDRRDVIVTSERKDMGRLLARIAELTARQFEARHMLLAGSADLRSAFTDALSPEFRCVLGGEFSVDLHAGAAAVSDAALSRQREIEAAEEVAILQDTIARTPGHAVWGVSEVLEALRRGRVMVLAADDRDPMPGGACASCGALWEATEGACGLCGGELRRIPDLLERLLEMGLTQQARLELVRSEAGRDLMRNRAPVAARLR